MALSLMVSSIRQKILFLPIFKLEKSVTNRDKQNS